MQNAKPITPQERDGQLRKQLRFKLSPAVERRAEAIARSLERIAGETVQVDRPDGGAIDDRDGQPIRRCSAAEAHRMGVWFSIHVSLDCREPDFLSQTSALLREHIAKLTKIENRLVAESKRRPKIARVSRKAGDAPSA